jgi:SAM-dependent methyltransferase
MPFYEDISKYYDIIFPTGKEQLSFIQKAAGSPPKELLDIACGTGGYSLALAGAGYKVTASDIDAAMLEGLKKKLQGTGLDIACIQAGMLDLDEKLQENYDLAFCIGNSVVHLNDGKEILQFFKNAKGLLKSGGQFIIQIINFDRVLLKDVRQLPLLRDEGAGLLFERYYRFEQALNKVFFRTVLSVDGERIENEIPLFPLQSADAVQMLKDAGFSDIRLFGDFSGSGYDREESFMLLLCGRA